jgi:uncharacterized protein (TIGR02453 family)
MAPNGRIPSGVFRFLGDLDKNNNRDWFNANKQRYIEEVRDPLLEFVDAFAPRLEKISPVLVADSRPNGGSLFRIYRDTRFSRDKRPYKTWVALRFGHIDAREVPTPGFYLHMEPGRSFAAAGMWHTESGALKQIRDAIVADPARWKKLKRRGLDAGDALKRAPRGYDPEHPLVEDLKLKGFTLSESFTQKDVCAPDFLNRFTRACKGALPLMEFLADAVDVDW